MTSFTLIKSKKNRLLLLLFSFAGIMYLATFLDGAYENIRLSTKINLEIVREFDLPLREISGMYLHPAAKPGAPATLYAVGDNAARLGIMDFNGEQVSNQRFIDFSAPILERFAPCRSDEIDECHKLVKALSGQWEAVARDGAGKIFLLHEKFASLFVLDPLATHLRGVINLSSFVPKGEAVLGRVSLHKDNAMGEGFLLLKNGHMLVVKERYPPSLIEFGPEGSHAEGFSPQLILGKDESFAVAAGQTSYEPLHLWNLEDKYRHCDLSELVASSEGELHVISQQCRWIGTFAPLSLQEKTAPITQLWHLPHQLGAAESLVIVDGEHFLVAEDRKSHARPTVFLLKKGIP
jgi:hypothetical protein